MEEFLAGELDRRLKNGGKTFLNVPMREHTSFRIGGPAELLVTASDPQDIRTALAFAKENRLDVTVIGNGTNLLASDSGIPGMVLKIAGRPGIRLTGPEEIEAGAGALLSSVARFALKNSLTGLEFASGIPGSLGGAVVMNAGAYGGEMRDVVEATRYMDHGGEEREVRGEAHRFAYRSSMFAGGAFIVLSSRLKLTAADPAGIRRKMEELSATRREKQPLRQPSAGSVFKRPEGCFAGKLIEDCGLKGFSVGGARVSEKHAGFIINTGGATCRDVKNLIGEIKKRVYEKFGVRLECEIRFVGEQE